MPGATAWLSRGLEELEHAQAGNPAAADFDVVIVGSGYGGAVAAAAFAGCATGEDGAARTISVCLLERGREYLPGMFPARMADLAGHVRFGTEGVAHPRGQREGLFDFRVGSDVSVLLASGLGGGSLINAGVMEEPAEEAFAGWPEGIYRDLRAGLFRRARQELGAQHGEALNTIEGHEGHPLAKYSALGRLAGAEPRRAAITIAMRDGENQAGVAMSACRLCGDCATGCNHEAKESLDKNLLVRAWRAGAQIYTGATVLKLERQEDHGRWALSVAHTDEKLRRRQQAPISITARHVVLAAGTLGSTELLLRSRSDDLRFSPRLGSAFSANGDSIAVVYGGLQRVNAVADESMPYAERGIGPTITGVVDLRRDAGACTIEELAIPGPLRRAFEETATTSRLLHALSETDWSLHRGGGPGHDPCAVDAKAIMSSSIVAMMGDDGAGGMLEAASGTGMDTGDGAIRVRWPDIRKAKVYSDQIDTLTALAKASDAKAKVLPNPLWQLLPQEMSFLIDGLRGPAFTVHPLGGCPMGMDASDGVVNDLGQVFRGSSGAAVWPGLAVLDGSIVRSALGTNPALTITALALRAAEGLRSKWRFSAPPPAQKGAVRRPVFAAPPPPARPRPTRAEVIERMSGEVTLTSAEGQPRSAVVELTLPFDPTDVGPLLLPQEGRGVPMARTLRVARDERGATKGRLRVFDHGAWHQYRLGRISEEQLEGEGLIVRADLSGTLRLLHREASWVGCRIMRGLWAYFLNRGLRDAWQARAEQPGKFNLIGRAAGAIRLASRAGESRLLEYDLVAERPAAGSQAPRYSPEVGAPGQIRGRKRLTYGRRSNPWRQLMEMQITACRGMWGWDNARRTLELDVKYLAGRGLPLLRLTDQHDQPSALADMASLAAYFARLLLNIHVWSFRKPDAPEERTLQQRPGEVPGLPKPSWREIEVDEPLPDDTPVKVRLTRYRPEGAEARPVVLIHGYSSGGTTFAHHAVRPNLAEFLCNAKRDVWVLDLRTSIGMPTWREPWSFEQVAFADLPAAFEEICRETRSETLDVFAHCMGAAMFSMAVLSDPPGGSRFAAQHNRLRERVRRAVLSQIGPVIVMSPANIFRGYVMSYLRHFLPLANYEFRVGRNAGLADQLIDRLLATLPYPDEEFDIENPIAPWQRTPFVGTRHRMDALYGRDFRLAEESGACRLDARVLDHIDDLFGPPNIDTVSQAIHFARKRMITDPTGRGYATRQALQGRWTFPTLSLHGAENGLSDVATLALADRLVRVDAGRNLQTRALHGFGHQDCLIGKDAARFFREVADFLNA